jgi:hypothetical protein
MASRKIISFYQVFMNQKNIVKPTFKTFIIIYKIPYLKLFLFFVTTKIYLEILECV